MDANMGISMLPSAQGPTDKSLRVTRTKLYPMHAWYCIGLFIFTIAVFQWFSFFHSKFARSRPTSNKSDPEQAVVHYRGIFSWRRIPLGLVNAYRVIAFRWTLEFGKRYTLNMAEVSVTMAYLSFLFIWAFINTTNLEGHALDITYWCNRSGTLAASQFPLITALGTKNNIVSLITGISYDKLNYVHRMMSRVVFILLCVHAGSEIVENAPFQPFLKEPWLRCGITAIVALTILCVVSLRPIRAQAYELFFYVHLAMVMTFLVCAYFHTQYDGLTYWIYPCFVIWGLDRLIRIVGLVVFNSSYFGFRSGSAMDATAELISDDFVRLRFHRPPHFRWAPGQTAYLIMPSVSRLPFEAHPFTIASFNSNIFDVAAEQKPEGEKYTQITDRALGSSAPFWKELVFFINVRQGFTARLKEAASRGDKLKVFIDGPYGPAPNLGSYDTSVLIAGGSGVSYTLPILLGIIEGVRNGKSSCGRVVFIWSIRNAGAYYSSTIGFNEALYRPTHLFLADQIHWIDETLIRALQLAPPSLSISIRIHVTGTPATDEALPHSYSPSDDARPVCNPSPPETVVLQDGRSKHSLFTVESAKLQSGRPNLPAILRDEVEMATGRMSVSVCGSQEIARSVRRALQFPVSSPLSVANGGPSVTLHIESFGYA
ncbi:ferric reductase like transmembrane component-domain-containing protein [Suillus clintonianus]|uniref:ferric reductase like transmembrane component-domain-containing protein n=1 Tax=Suillus clintonianus TaxID=1904413 RepID=UPI001B881CC9|nr:ferric reductase like transmembrane component-domain-containing protein [Suillus clintonianus]KAG2138475.1 ferric reductase like transmembrane component-domain-containing protein [Suillus clintonianus]